MTSFWLHDNTRMYIRSWPKHAVRAAYNKELKELCIDAKLRTNTYAQQKCCRFIFFFSQNCVEIESVHTGLKFVIANFNISVFKSDNLLTLIS